MPLWPLKIHFRNRKLNSVPIGTVPLNSKAPSPPTQGPRHARPTSNCSRWLRRHPQAHNFQAFCIYITWQQVTEETIAHHFHTGMRLSEAYLATPDGKDPRHLAYISELLESFRGGLGLDEEDDIVVEFQEGHAQGWRLTDGEKDPQLCSRKTLPPHFLGGVHKRDALYSARREPQRAQRTHGTPRPFVCCGLAGRPF